VKPLYLPLDQFPFLKAHLCPAYFRPVVFFLRPVLPAPARR
jgi:hypothetical protein